MGEGLGDHHSWVLPLSLIPLHLWIPQSFQNFHKESNYPQAVIRPLVHSLIHSFIHLPFPKFRMRPALC